MSPDTYQYLKPTDEQMQTMEIVRNAAAAFSNALVYNLPDGPDKTYLLRKHREVAMWANVTITRQPDGSPRT